jgi:cytochrome c1
MGDIDVGYGPTRSFTQAEVEKIAAFLEAQGEAVLRQRLVPKKMALLVYLK